MLYMNGAAALETAETMAARIDEFGTPKAYNHYAVGWAHATGTPYQWTKQVASHYGGTRNGTVVSWPNGFAARGELRHQFHHVIDVAPTILEAAGIPAPERVNGFDQRPLEGVSMAYSFGDAAAPDRHETQYFEMVGNRGIYHKGWTAVTKHATPWIAAAQLPALDADTWELYDTTTDWTQARDLSAEMPEKLAELQALFIEEARKYQVLPLDDRRIERFNAQIAGRPVVVSGETQMLYGGVGRLTEATVLSVKNRSHAVTAKVEVKDAAGTGVMMAQGGEFGGWALYLKDGRPTYCHNFIGIHQFKVGADEAITEGSHEVRMDFAYAGGGLGKGGTVTLSIDGRQVGQGELPATVPMLYSLDETADIGRDTASPVSDDYTGATSEFPGTVDWVRLDVGEAALEHEIPAEDKIRIAFARQ
jgi:arylsulfatase